MKAIVAAIHGILTRQTEPSWPDKFDAWMLRRDPEIKMLKKEYLAGPFPRWNCRVKNPLLARGLASELELFAAIPPSAPSSAEGSAPSPSPISSPPIWLVAHSNGAVIALLVTKRLVARGFQVGGLILTGAACDANIDRNGIRDWIESGKLGAAIAYSSREDKVLAGGPSPDSRERWSFRRWAWSRLIRPYGTLGLTGWVTDESRTARRAVPTGQAVILTRWHNGGHSGLFAPENIEATFEQIYRDITMPRSAGVHVGFAPPSANPIPDSHPVVHQPGTDLPAPHLSAFCAPLGFAQLAPPPAGSIETWLLCAAAVGSILLLVKKLAPRKAANDSEMVRRSEFHDVQATVEALRDKIDARFLGISDKIERLGDSIHKRLNELEAGLARVDERTRGR